MAHAETSEDGRQTETQMKRNEKLDRRPAQLAQIIRIGHDDEALERSIRNPEGEEMNPRTAFLTFATTMLASRAAVSVEGPVVWADTTCGYFIVQLPEGNPAETFGLFRSNTKAIPKVGDIVEGDIVATYKVDVTDKATGEKYSLLHWANGKSQETLVRHSPVYCASRYSKK